MRLYVACRHCGNKIYINSPARIRAELPYQFVLRCKNLGCPMRYNNEVYTSYDVVAETGFSGTVGGAIVTGVLGGLVAGPIGAAIGALVGGSAGSNTDRADREAVERFNKS